MNTLASRKHDDREFRRGMILGLSLAEVLLLLLFILMFAFGSELVDMQEKLSDGNNTTTQDHIDQLEKSLALARKKNSELQNVYPNRLLAQEYNRALELAAEIDPADPPAALQRALEFQKSAMGLNLMKNSAPDVLSELVDSHEALLTKNTELQNKISSLENFQKLYELIQSKTSDSISEQETFELLEEALSASDNFQELNERRPSTSELIASLKKNTVSLKENKTKWPPIINLSEANGNYFEIGSASLTEKFKSNLRSDILNRLIELLQKYDVDTIEIIGHTDEQPIRGRESNLDKSLLDVVFGKRGPSNLIAADNAGLGMARAVSVLTVLREDKRLDKWKIIPLSGAQLIESDGELTKGNDGDLEVRRRIEIRLRKSDAGR